MSIPGANGFELKNKGMYDSNELISNAQLIFDNIQLEEIEPSAKKQDLHFMFEPSKENAGSYTLYLSVIFKNCHHFRGDFGGNMMNLLFENCTINELHGSNTNKLPGSINFSNCKFKHISSTAIKPFSLASILGTMFTNCIVFAPNINGQSRPDLLHLTDFVQLNKAVKYNHLNTRLGNDILKYCRKEGIVIDPVFINMLKSHHEL